MTKITMFSWKYAVYAVVGPVIGIVTGYANDVHLGVIRAPLLEMHLVDIFR